MFGALGERLGRDPLRLSFFVECTDTRGERQCTLGVTRSPCVLVQLLFAARRPVRRFLRSATAPKRLKYIDEPGALERRRSSLALRGAVGRRCLRMETIGAPSKPVVTEADSSGDVQRIGIELLARRSWSRRSEWPRGRCAAMPTASARKIGWHTGNIRSSPKSERRISVRSPRCSFGCRPQVLVLNESHRTAEAELSHRLARFELSRQSPRTKDRRVVHVLDRPFSYSSSCHVPVPRTTCSSSRRMTPGPLRQTPNPRSVHKSTAFPGEARLGNLLGAGGQTKTEPRGELRTQPTVCRRGQRYLALPDGVVGRRRRGRAATRQGRRASLS